MRKIFIGISNILLITIMFVYSWISCINVDGMAESILVVTGRTGLPILGIIFMIPAFVFTIITLCEQKKMIIFIRDMFSFFASVFVLISTISAVACYASSIYYYYVPVMLIIVSAIDLGFAGYGVLKEILAEGKNKDVAKEENKPQQ